MCCEFQRKCEIFSEIDISLNNFLSFNEPCNVDGEEKKAWKLEMKTINTIRVKQKEKKELANNNVL